MPSVTLDPSVIDIVPNRIAHDFWVKRQVDNPEIAQTSTSTSRIIFEYSSDRDDTTSNISNMVNNYNAYVGVSEDPRENGYNPYGEIPVYTSDKYFPDLNWINRVTDELDHVGNRMVLTPQLIRFNNDVFYLSYDYRGPILNSREFGVIKILNDGVHFSMKRGSWENTMSAYTQVESMYVKNDSLVIKMYNGMTYNFDKDLRYTITTSDRKYSNKTVDDTDMTSLFEGHQRVDLHDLDYKLLYYDEETSTGVAVEDKHDRIILINYNNSRLCDYMSNTFYNINESLFSNVDTCSAFIKGNYLVIRDEILGFSIYSINREENCFQLEHVIWAGPEVQMYPNLKASFVVFDDDVYIPNGRSIYRVQLRPFVDVEVYTSRFTIKQLYEFNGVLMALCQDPFVDEDEYLYDVTFVALFNIGYRDKDKALVMTYADEENSEEILVAYQTGYTNLGGGSAISYISNSFVGLDIDGPRTDIPLVLIPLSKYNLIEIYAEGSSAGFHFSVDYGTNYKTRFHKLSLVWGNRHELPSLFQLNSELRTIAGYPYLIKNGLKTRIDSLISKSDGKSSVSMSADINSVKNSSKANFITDEKDVRSEDVVSSILSQKDGFIRNFDSDTIYMVSKTLGDKFVVYDKYTDRKRIDQAVADVKTSSTFAIIETDRYLVRVARDIDPKISMYMRQLKDADLDRLCSNIVEDKFL